MKLEDIVQNGLPALPEGAIRYAVKLTGLEPEHAYGTLKSLSILAEKVFNFFIFVYILFEN